MARSMLQVVHLILEQLAWLSHYIHPCTIKLLQQSHILLSTRCFPPRPLDLQRENYDPKAEQNRKPDRWAPQAVMGAVRFLVTVN